MKRIVVKLSGMPFDPTYEIDDDGCHRRPGPSARQQFSFHRGRGDWNGDRPGKLLYRAMQACYRSQVTAYQQGITYRIHFSCEPTARRGETHSWRAAMYHWTLLSSGPGRAAVTRCGVQPGGVDWTTGTARA